MVDLDVDKHADDGSNSLKLDNLLQNGRWLKLKDTLAKVEKYICQS